MSAVMRSARNLALAAVLLTIGAVPARAASEDDYKAAFAAADAAEKQADALRNKWTTTEAELAAAKKAAAAGDFDAAIASARNAEAMAKASVFQATSERERWKDMEIR
jgi:multidrug resistance efflux pump